MAAELPTTRGQEDDRFRAGAAISGAGESGSGAMAGTIPVFHRKWAEIQGIGHGHHHGGEEAGGLEKASRAVRALSGNAKTVFQAEKNHFGDLQVRQGGVSLGNGTAFASSKCQQDGIHQVDPTHHFPDKKVSTMNRRTFAAAALSLVMVASAALHASAAPVLNVYYTGSTGNIKVQNTTSGSVPVQSFNIITLGNGAQGDLSGLPGDIGYLNATAATMPVAPGAFLTSNTSAFGLNGIYSQVFAAYVGQALFTLAPYPGWSEAEPIGPVGSFYDLGNIAPTGLTQTNLDTFFLTDLELTPPDYDVSAYGKFLFTYETSPGNFSADTLGDVKLVPQAVPEPSTYAMLLSALACGGWMVRRRKSA